MKSTGLSSLCDERLSVQLLDGKHIEERPEEEVLHCSNMFFFFFS